MEIPGTKPKPTRIKKLNGNPSGRPLNKKEPKPIKSKEPKEWSVVKKNKIAHAAFVDNVKILNSMQMLTDAVITLLNVLCICQARIEEAEEQISKDGITTNYTNTRGETNPVSHPSVGTSIKYAQMLRSICTEFGMTPSSRGRLQLPTEKIESDFDGLLD